MRFITSNINADSHALIRYGHTGEYSVKHIEYTDEDFEHITFEPDGDTRETYRSSSRVLFTYPTRFVANQEPATTRTKAHVIAIGDKEALEALKSSYETVAIYTKTMRPNSAIAEVLLHMAKNEPCNMSNHQLQELANQNAIPRPLKNALQALHAENTVNSAQARITCLIPHRKTNWHLDSGLYLHQGECLHITFKDAPDAPEPYWAGYTKFGDQPVSATVENVNHTQYDAQLEIESRKISLFISYGNRRNVESFEIMPGICSAHNDTALPRVYIVDNGKPCMSAPLTI